MTIICKEQQKNGKNSEESDSSMKLLNSSSSSSNSSTSSEISTKILLNDNDNKNKNDIHTSKKGDTNGTLTCNTGVCAVDSVIEQQSQQKKIHLPSNNYYRSMIFFGIGILLRTLFFDAPVVGMFAISVGTQFLLDLSYNFLLPQVELQIFDSDKAERGLTYYHHVCTADSTPTANNTDGLIVSDIDNTAYDVYDMMLKHGLVVFPQLLTDETATELRTFILEENTRSKELIYVIKNKNRWSFHIQIEQHPSIAKALDEILNHNPKLIDTLELIMGRNPAVIEFTAITSGYGAVEQHWHQDVVPASSGAKYGRSYIPSYSLFIPLQNTTAAMGATGICPGTHMCGGGASKICSQTGFQVSGDNDNWPLGYGALVNQQTTHRGEAHTDPNGPHRVLFILTFAPRPLVSDQTVETKIIGGAGSYSLHWSNYGHTLKDYQNPLVRMKQPFRTLRSLGLYNPAGSDNWGWDYITVSSGRIANTDTGFAYGDLEEFVVTKGGFQFIPNSLHATLKNEDDFSEDVPNRNPWIEYLMETLHNVSNAAKKAHLILLSLYILVILCWNLICQLYYRCRNVTDGNSLRATSTFMILVRLATRIAFLHGVIWYISQTTKDRVSQSTWARNIQSKRSFVLPNQSNVGVVSHTTGNNTKVPSLLNTLPNRNDILLLENMKSSYMHSYNNVLDVFHPGNRAWYTMIRQNCGGYDNLSTALQRQLRSSLLQWSRVHHHSRILMQDYNSNWGKVPDSVADSFCHESLLALSSKSGDSRSSRSDILEQLDFIKSEMKFGYFRDSVMHRRSYLIRKLIEQIRKKILWYNNSATKTDKREFQSKFSSLLYPSSQMIQMKKAPLLKVTSHHRRLANYRASIRPMIRKLNDRNSIAPSGVSDQTENDNKNEPFEGAWIQEGDLVEAAYEGNKFEWYTAVVIGASSNMYKWAVEYADGEQDVGLCSTCLRRYVPYQIGERVETRLETNSDEYEYFPGTVTSSNLPSMPYTFSIQLDNGRKILDVPVSEIRRGFPVSSSFTVHTRIESRYPGEPGKWFSGTIAKVNSDGRTYAIQYDDGDYLPKVNRDHIRLKFDDMEEEDE